MHNLQGYMYAHTESFRTVISIAQALQTEVSISALHSLQSYTKPTPGYLPNPTKPTTLTKSL